MMITVIFISILFDIYIDFDLTIKRPSSIKFYYHDIDTFAFWYLHHNAPMVLIRKLDHGLKINSLVQLKFFFLATGIKFAWPQGPGIRYQLSGICLYQVSGISWYQVSGISWYQVSGISWYQVSMVSQQQQFLASACHNSSHSIDRSLKCRG